MGRIFVEHLTGGSIYCCSHCSTHLAKATSENILSKDFTGKTGTAYLFYEVINYVCGVSEDRQLRTGVHTIADIFCKKCSKNVGWKYFKAYEPSQVYKEGNYILEKALIQKLSGK